MELHRVPDVKFKPTTVGTVTYRVPTLDADPNSCDQKLRTHCPQSSYSKTAKVQVEEDEPLFTVCGVENPFAGIFEDGEVTNIEADLARPEEGHWVVEHDFSHHFHKAAFGKRLSKLKSLEHEYDCKIEIHKLDAIRISSYLKAKIEKLLEYLSEKSSQTKLKYTHFVCVPLVSPEVSSSLESLAGQVQDERLRSAMVSPLKLHYTIAMLKLVNERDINRAKSILSSFSNAWNSNGLPIDLKGIQVMPGSTPQDLRVAYTGGAGGEGSGGWREKLKTLAGKLVEQLAAEGFVDLKKAKSYFDGMNGTLHATILNSKYAARSAPGELSSSESEDEHTDRRVEWNPNAPPVTKGSRGIDARSFLQRFSNFCFGQTTVTELRLCTLVEKPDIPRDPNGFYQTLFIVKL
jgi:2'-5' RNA ligase